eukprot:TRINITY_DN5232_c0_g1_i1.p1 TRINITY_DN5232_c0_g1~~TRINITY_DN5232_c0_g1_i1.p1  ORF type:complete len:299 (+),score=19.42 TRINITY_DN5232_c0_g1_i1:110-1006(+)
MPTLRKFFALLDIPEGSGSSEIKRAYHKLALETHPDRVEGGDAEQFKRVHEAYEILTDTSKRKAYLENGSDSDSLPASSPMQRSRSRRKTPAHRPHPSPSMRPFDSPNTSSDDSSRSKRPFYQKPEFITILLVIVLVALLTTNGGQSLTLSNLRNSLSRKATDDAQPHRITHNILPSITITGGCPESRNVVEGVFTHQGVLLGRPWFKQKKTGSMMYYDSSCDGQNAPAGWFIMDQENSNQIIPEPKFGTGCGTTARLAWAGATVPFGEHEWEMACASNVPTKVMLSITEGSRESEFG